MGFSTETSSSSNSSTSTSSTTNSTSTSSILLQQCSEGLASIPLQTEEDSEPPEFRSNNNIMENHHNNNLDRKLEAHQSNNRPQEIITTTNSSSATSREEENGHSLQFNCPAFSYMNPKIRCTRSVNGVGLFTKEPVAKDELILGWSGKVVHVSEILAMHESERTYILQIDEQLFQVPFWKGYNEPADFVNHSCNPNCGFGDSPIALVAMREIKVGEEITFDYCMCESVEGLKGNEFECACEAPDCRGAFTGSDWKNPKLWNKYGKYFSPHIRKKIKQLKKQQTISS